MSKRSIVGIDVPPGFRVMEFVFQNRGSTAVDTEGTSIRVRIG
jgi:hypothetical protein